MQVIEQDENNEMAWLWLSGVVKEREDRLICLENVLAINPENKIAKKGLSKLDLPASQPLNPPTPEEENEEHWDQPQYDLVLPEAHDPHAHKF